MSSASWPKFPDIDLARSGGQSAHVIKSATNAKVVSEWGLSDPASCGLQHLSSRPTAPL